MLRNRQVRCVLAAAGSFLLAAASLVSAQGFQGGLRGAVSDANGVIPGVEVTLVNEATNISRSTFTNETGEYAFTAVNPGTYTLRAVLQGFKTYERQGIRIGTQQFITLDVMMEVGTIQEEISVTADAPLIETSNASQGSSLNREILENLPAPGRAAFLVGVTVPTVVASGDAQFNRQQDQTNASLVSLGGGARRANNYILDGFPIVDMRNRAVVNPTIEAIDEVKVQVHTYDAEMGRTGGGVFNTTFRSGTNEFHGSAFYQTRPTSMLEQNFFLERAGVEKPDQYYRLFGGGAGGPIVRNRTFFWAANEGYKSATTRNGNLIFPTNLELQGDFSQSFDRDGNLLVIYDPLTTRPDPNNPGRFIRDPFPGNRIPANRISPVARNISQYFPAPDQQVSNQQPNYVRQSFQEDLADMQTLKLEHKFTDNISLSGVYFYNRTDEPFAEYFPDDLAFADPAATPLRRRIHGVVLNNTILPNATTVVSLRYGWNRFNDDCVPKTEFDVGTLGFAPSFVNDIQFSKFPQIQINDYGEVGSDNTLGASTRNDIQWYSWGFNGAVSKLVGRHTFKFGADYMRIGVNTQPFGNSSGSFDFGADFTAARPGASGSGSPFASFLLGYPESGNADISTRFQMFTNYYGAYVQDDFRVNSKFTLNYGVRFEHEDGLMEENNAFTVGFDRDAVSPLSSLVPGLGTLSGGLLYAGADGANEYQGDPPAMKISPRVGAVYQLNDATVVRGGYGMFWAPWNYQFPSTTNYGQTGFNQRTTLIQNSQVPTVTLSNPFPGGLLEPTGSSLGLLTSTGTTVTTIDQNKEAPYVQQYSVDVQRELPGNMAVTLGYTGARGDNLGLGGTNDGAVNINQIPMDVALALGPAFLNQRVANPFRDIPEAGGFANLATIEQGQLLRPFPQFRDINILQVTQGISRYHAFIVQLDKRMSNYWAGRFSWTYSQLKDNQFAESNHYADRTNRPQDNYNLDAEFANSLLDMPHKIIFAPIIQLPFGQGRKWATSGVADWIVGGWTISAVAQLESGFPTAVVYGTSIANNRVAAFGDTVLRPNPTGADPETSGDTIARLDGWVNPDAYEQPALGTLGTLPRTDTRVRTPFRKNLDVVFNKAFRTGGNTRAELRFEMLNITNTPKFRDYETELQRGTFGLITRQSGFMRITQITFRFTF